MRFKLTIIILTLVLYSCRGKVQFKTDTESKKILFTKQNDTTKGIDTSTTKKTGITIDSLPKINFGKMIMISSAQTSASQEVKIKGITFDLVLNDGDTSYLETTENHFTTPEGFSVGMQLNDLPQDFKKSLTKEPGWAYYYKLPSGWALGFCEGNSCTDYYPNPDSKVKWIFKRK